MRCKKCEYPLWNLPPGACPECGNEFRPGAFEFKVGEVRFCCPHCDQAYYGDTTHGHLDPSSFDCVGCGRSIEQDECIVRPLEGQDAIDTTLAPWFDSTHGLFKRTVFTAGWAMVRPGDLARGIPRDSSPNAGIVFLLLVNILALVVGFLPIIFVVMAVPLWTQGLNAVNAPGIGMATGVVSIFGGFTFATSVVSVLLIALVGHGILRLTGPVDGGLGRTVTLACFGSGPVLIVAIPCLGPYCGSQVSGVWAIVSTILLLAAGQRVGGGRATLAVLTVPVLAILAFIGFMVISAAVTTTARPVGARPLPNLALMSAVEVEDDVEGIVRELLPEIANVSATAILDVKLPVRLRADGLGDLVPAPFTATSSPTAGCITWFAGDLWLTVIPGTAPGGGASKCVIGLRSDPARPDRITMITIDGKDGNHQEVGSEAFHEALNERLDYLGLGVEDPISTEVVEGWLRRDG